MFDKKYVCLSYMSYYAKLLIICFISQYSIMYTIKVVFLLLSAFSPPHLNISKARYEFFYIKIVEKVA